MNNIIPGSDNPDPIDPALQRIWDRQLADLNQHWDEAYHIACDPGGAWVALGRWQGAKWLTADTAAELRDKIRDDYAEHKGVPEDQP